MNWEAIGASAEVFGVVTILVSLIYVAIQIRQNNEQQRLQSYQSWVAANMELNMALLDQSLTEIFDVGNTNPAKLSKDNFVPYGMWNTGLMQMAQATDYLYRAGSLDHELWESELNRAALCLSLPGPRQWWDAGGKTQLTPKFVKLIESIEPSATAWGFEEGRGFVPLTELSDRS